MRKDPYIIWKILFLVAVFAIVGYVDNPDYYSFADVPYEYCQGCHSNF